MNPGLVVKLRPTGPWRIGPDSGARNRVDTIYHSDSLYSAVTAAMVRTGMLEEWLDATARNGVPAVCFSSCFPFVEEINFVVPPRTVWPPTSPALMSSRVRWKSARFIPLEVVESVLSGRMPDDRNWSVDGPSECLVPAGRPGPFRTGVRWSAAVDRLTGAAERHSTACIEFRPGAGLWTTVSFADEAARDRWLGPVKTCFRLLADTGFGGERSRGWGRSEPPEFIEGLLPEMILKGQGPIGGQGPARGQGSGAGGQGVEPSAEVRSEERPAPLAVSEAQTEPPVTEAAPAEELQSEESGQPETQAETPAPEPIGGQGPGAGGQGVELSAEVRSEERPLPLAVSEAQPTASGSEAVPAEEPKSEASAQPETQAETPAPEPIVEAAPEPEVSSAEQPVAEPEPEKAAEAEVPPAPGPRPPAPAGGQAHWLLSLFTPADTDSVDWSRGNYDLAERGGRVDSPASSGDLKKQIRMIAEGSVIYSAEPPRGTAANVAPEDFPHPVFRAGFALSIPLPKVS